MGFSKFFDKVTDKIQETFRDDDGPPPVPSASKPSGPLTAAPEYFRANFSQGTQVNSQVKHECGDWGWGNNELQNYTDSPENSFHTPDNKLVLRAVIANGRPDNKYTSARLRVHHTLARQNGYVEATISSPCAKGIWPAFWLLPSEPFNWPVDGEVDIMEHWNADPTNHCCLHWGHFHGEDMSKHKVHEEKIQNITQPHVFGLAWEQPGSGDGGRLIWYIDGRPVMKAWRPWGTRRMEDFQVILNIAVGGNVNNGAVPDDGTYDLVVHELKMCEGPPGGMEMFEHDWQHTAEGHGY